ncbi:OLIGOPEPTIDE TRANSPORTER-RELATED [Salix purpurea]|uniref:OLIGOPEPTIDE TRANSPORTER-RELATED n=1 Tax=Salix purpurea TaxID=77065 RepID=A0A9Q0VXC1_SALPP|nr:OLIGOPEPTIDE TRANSPORTER-RELATED [Salix purpurea]
MEFQDDNKSHEAEKPEEVKIKEYDNRKKLGGMKTIPFILGECVFGLQLNLPLVKASNIVSNFDGTSSLTPLIGALIADSFAGRFWTIIVGSIIYELGLISITTTALLKSMHPPPCPSLVDCKEASGIQLSTLYLSLLLLAVGLGGTRPCVMNYAADQVDMSKSSVESRTWNFFNWYYFSLGFARLTAVTVVVYVQDNVSWGWGLGIPTITMAAAFIVFLSGSPLYKKVKPGGSPLVRVIQVIFAAIRKRKAVAPEDPSLLYQNQELDSAISVHGRLLHTPQFKWLDKAAVVKNGEAAYPSPPNLWKLATVHRVEELKSFLRLLPVWAAGILLVTANSHSSSFNTQQARTMDRHLSSSFQIPPASMSFFGIVTVIIGLALYERLFVPFARRFTRNSAGITYLQRMGIGLLFNILSTAVAALVEKKRRTHSLHGMTEVFMVVGQLEFLYDQSPESMRSIALGLFLDRELCWKLLGHIHGIQAVNFVYFVICAWCYSYKPLEEDSEATEDGADRNGKIELTTAEKVQSC